METVVVRRNRIAGFLAAAGTGGPLALMLAGVAGLMPGAAAGIAFNLLFYSWIPAIIWYGFYFPKRIAGTVEAADGVLRAKDARGAIELRATRGRIDRLRDGRWRVEARRGRWRRVRLEVATEEQARAIITSLGIDRREGTTQFVVQSNVYDSLYPIALSALFVALVAGSQLIAELGYLIPVVVVAAFASYFASRRVTLTVGLDGISLTSLRKKQFLPHSKIRGVYRTTPRPPVVVSPGIRIELDDGTRLVFDTRGTRFNAEVWETDPVFDAITGARARATGDASATALLQKGQRTTQEWLAALRAMGEGKTNYRVASLDERSLESVLADANAPVEARAAAAVALRAKDPERLRIAIEEVADANVREVALAEDDEVEGKLAALARNA